VRTAHPAANLENSGRDPEFSEQLEKFANEKKPSLNHAMRLLNGTLGKITDAFLSR